MSVQNLTKTFGSLRAVDDLTFDVRPGRITGFLGPNGAGKTTTLRMLLGLVRPTSGQALIGDERYVNLRHPIQTVGAALEATGFHPGRSGRNHLRVLAATEGIADSRVDELLELVGIPAAARKRAGGYSMGMRQRLGLAAALLGDPRVLLLDEPTNGLDPEGIRWMRGFLRHLAEGVESNVGGRLPIERAGGEDADAAHALPMVRDNIVKARHSHPVLCEPFQIDVRHDDVFICGKSLRFSQAFVIFVNQRMAIPCKIRRAFAPPGGGENIGREGSRRLAGAKRQGRPHRNAGP